MVSFDFDGTLSRPDVQEYAAELISRGLIPWIVTARLGKEYLLQENSSWNDDLYEVSKRLGIPDHQIRFMNYSPKSDFFDTENFLWHLDDDHTELFDIKRAKTKTIPIQVNSGMWRSKCERLLFHKTKVGTDT